jgi:hypothetical protein
MCGVQDSVTEIEWRTDSVTEIEWRTGQCH